MQTRIAVHLVLICVFGQIHSATFKIGKFSFEDSRGVLVSFGIANDESEATMYNSKTSDYFCLKHTEQAYLNFFYSEYNKLEEKIFFRIDNQKYEEIKSYEHNVEISKKRNLCFLFGSWMLRKGFDGTQYEVYITFLSQIQIIEPTKVAYFSLFLSHENIMSHLSIDNNKNLGKISDEIDMAIASVKDQSKKNKFTRFNERQKLLIGFLKCYHKQSYVVNLSIDSDSYTEIKDGNFHMMIFNDEISNKDIKDALDNFIASPTYEKVENKFASITCNENYINIKTKYEFPALKETSKKDNVPRNEKGKPPKNLKIFKQHI